MIFASAVDNYVGLGLAVLLGIFLVLVLIFPEKF